MKACGVYTVLSALGRGTWLAADPDGQPVALKCAPDGAGPQWLAGADLAAALPPHPHVVPVLAYGWCGAVAYVAMPYIGGQTLQARLGAGTAAPAQALAWAMELLDALAHVHAGGVVHRDVKPGNLMVNHQGRLLLVDFGLACRPGAAPAHGTPGYMAPEQMRGRVDARSDVYAAGVVLYRMLAGRLPFSGTPFEAMQQALRGQVPPLPALAWLPAPLRAALDAVLARALAAEPGARFAGAAAMRAALHNSSLF